MLCARGHLILSQSRHVTGEIDKSLIHGQWLHSHDEEGKAIFRPATEDFPPTRGGRMGLSFEPGGRVVRRSPGPADRGQFTEGMWSLDDSGVLTLQFPDGPREAMTIDSLASDRL